MSPSRPAELFEAISANGGVVEGPSGAGKQPGQGGRRRVFNRPDCLFHAAVVSKLTASCFACFRGCSCTRCGSCARCCCRRSFPRATMWRTCGAWYRQKVRGFQHCSDAGRAPVKVEQGAGLLQLGAPVPAAPQAPPSQVPVHNESPNSPLLLYMHRQAAAGGSAPVPVPCSRPAAQGERVRPGLLRVWLGVSSLSEP